MKKYILTISLSLLPFLPLHALANNISLTDYRNHKTELAKPAQRVACLYAFTGHTMLMLGKEESIVAVVRGLKRDKLVTEIAPRLKDLTVPSRGGEIQIEGLLTSAPDLVLLKPETAIIDAERAKLERFNLPYYTAGYKNMAGQIKVIEDIGTLVGAEERAKEYGQYYRETIERVSTIAQTIPEETRLRFYYSVNEIYRTNGADTLEADWTSKCGGINVSLNSQLEQKSDKYFASMEQILIWNPEVIFAGEKAAYDEIIGSPKWREITAVKTGRVYLMPVGISRWGHPGGLETPLAMLWTIKALYPEYTKTINMVRETKDFYKRFFNLELSDKKANTILAGKGMRREK